MNRRLLVGLVSFAALWLGFRGFGGGVVPHEQFDESTHVVGPLYSSEGIAELAAAFRREVPGPIRVVRLNIFPGHALLRAQDPRDPTNVDTYRYARGRIEVEPVQNPDVTESELFSLEGVALDAVPRVVDDAVREFREPGADVTSVSVSRSGSVVTIRAHLESLRETGTVSFDAQGALLEPAG